MKKTRIRRMLSGGFRGNSCYFVMTDTVGVEEALGTIGFHSIEYGASFGDGPLQQHYSMLARDDHGNAIGLRRVTNLWELAVLGAVGDARSVARRFIDVIGTSHTARLFDAQGSRYEILDTRRGFVVKLPGKEMTVTFRNGEAVITTSGALVHEEEEETLIRMLHHIIGGSVIGMQSRRERSPEERLP